MNAVLLTLLALGGTRVHITSSADEASYYVSDTDSSCDECGDGEGLEAGSRRDYRKYKHAAAHMMPQTCYSPRYGCYGSNDRHTQRYPAFHGSYYRRPYNYRHLFDYPWHAELHEPTSLFSYNVEVEEVVPSTDSSASRTQRTIRSIRSEIGSGLPRAVSRASIRGR